MAQDPSQPESQPVPTLRSLGPAFDEKLHGRHAEVLLRVLRDTSAEPAKNIALAGHYGSGKSSVILGVQQGLTDAKIEWVNLSLSSLGFDDTKRARVQEDGSVPPLTNVIQKEIVKQLLYRKAPAAMPGSRYFRIEAFRTGPAVAWSAVVGVTFTVVSVLLGLRGRIDKVAPRKLLDAQDSASWLILLALGLFCGLVWFLGLRTFQNRLRVESLSAGGAAVSLKAKENSYFDEYLDEIVYFFQQTRTAVAIFEDLDRFRDPHIFETLRELNTVLNNSEQIKSRPIRFVYAVRDSIFEQLNTATSAGGTEQQAATAPGRGPDLETLPSTNRTKFFDLVVPMVPFLTHRSARDLVAQEFEGSLTPPSSELVNLVGAHLTDMRLIRNIRNEFEIYSASVLGPDGLKGLTADRLFAMLVYKNLHLEDFEAIRLGKSRIDDAYDAYRTLVDHQISHQARVSARALEQLSTGTSWADRAAAAGERLRQVLPIVHRAAGRGGRLVLRHQSTTFEPEQFGSSELWRSLYQHRDQIQVLTPGYGSIQLSFAEFLSLIDAPADLEPLVSRDEQRLQRQSRLALETKDFISRASMAQMLTRRDLTLPRDDGARSLADIVATHVSPLGQDLLTKGYIDENFTLYCSDYHAIAISVSAMNFILHCVQLDKADYRFRFDKSESIASVEAEVGTKFLNGESAFNIDVFDHYLDHAPNRLATAFGRLVAPEDPRADFIDVYLSDGSKPGLLIQQLMDQWPDAFVHLHTSATLDANSKVSLVDVALRCAPASVDYATSEGVAALLSGTYQQMPIFTEALDPAAAQSLAARVAALGATVDQLSVLGPEQRRAIAAAGLFPVTVENVRSALGLNRTPALDEVRELNSDVYRHVLSQVDRYVAFLNANEPTVLGCHLFRDVLNDVSAVAPAAVEVVAELAAPACVITQIQDLATEAHTGIVGARRFTTTVANVHLLTRSLGITSALAAVLTSAGLLDATAVPEAERVELGLAIANSEYLNPDQRVRLVQDLELASWLDVDALDAHGLKALAELVAADIVADDAATYAAIAARPFAEREKYFTSSPALAGYVRDLQLSGDDIARLIKSPGVRVDVKRAIAGDADFLAGSINRTSAVALTEWARKGHELSIEVLVVLSEKGAPAALIVDLLTTHLQEVELAVLDRILVALGDSCEPLTRTGRHRPRISKHPGTVELLEELKRRNRVSSYSKATFSSTIRVNMRQ